MGSLLRVVSMLVLTFSAAPGFSAEAPGSSERTVPIHYEQRDISQVVEAVARATGRRYIFPDTMRGRVTITVPGRVSEDEAIALLDAALHVRGFAALPIADDTTKIVPITEVQTGAPLVEGETDPERERPITTLLRLRHASAGPVVRTLRPFISNTGRALAYPPTNSVILAGTEARVSRLITLIRILDQAADESILVRTLRYRSASAISEILTMKFNEGPVVANHVEIWVDERTNQIIARAPPSKLAEVRSTIEKLDRPIEGEGQVRVVRIVNREAEQVGELLLEMQKTDAGQATRSPAAQPSSSVGGGLSGRVYSVTADPATQSLVLASDPETLSILLEVIAQLDLLPARIAVDILLFEVSRPKNFELGIDYFLPLLEPGSITDPAVFLSSGGSSIINSPTGIPTTGVPSLPSAGDYIFGRYTRSPLQLTFDPGGGADPITISVPRESVAFKAGEFQAETNILMRPHILAMSGEEHEIFVGNEIPVPQSSSASTQTTGSSLSTRQIIERREVGIELRVKPTLGAEGRVILDLEIEISQLQASIAGSVEEVGPTFAQRTIESTLILGEGEYAVLGTSNGEADQDITTGVPILKDIPFFGFFFRSVSETRIETDLLVVVEASIMRSPSEDVAYSIRRRIAMERAMSRVSDLQGVDAEPFAVLVDTVDRESRARGIADAFSEDGFETRVTDWRSTGGRLWDVYLTDFESFEKAGRVARSLFEAGWSPEVTLLSPQNVLAGD
ncbi:MAG: hypothetical protein NZ990_01355 [Myxococcota bacterium]|nr:hypothetical protein [Myxococcota bacterium]